MDDVLGVPVEVVDAIVEEKLLIWGYWQPNGISEGLWIIGFLVESSAKDIFFGNVFIDDIVLGVEVLIFLKLVCWEVGGVLKFEKTNLSGVIGKLDGLVLVFVLPFNGVDVALVFIVEEALFKELIPDVCLMDWLKLLIMFGWEELWIFEFIFDIEDEDDDDDGGRWREVEAEFEEDIFCIFDWLERYNAWEGGCLDGGGILDETTYFDIGDELENWLKLFNDILGGKELSGGGWTDMEGLDSFLVWT